MGRLRSQRRTDDVSNDKHTLSMADMMTGLMIIFLFIAISYARNVSSERDAMAGIVDDWVEAKGAIYGSLVDELGPYLAARDATIDESSLTVRFHESAPLREPTILFEQGKAEINPRFKDTLAGFCPGYIRILQGFKDHVAEIRIEGHTSPEWNDQTSDHESYFENMELSQDRARAVLRHCLELDGVRDRYQWARTTIAAAGMSSSRPIPAADGRVDLEASRRVEFRVITNSDARMDRVREVSGDS